MQGQRCKRSTIWKLPPIKSTSIAFTVGIEVLRMDGHAASTATDANDPWLT
jgi:hypothetical protein